MQLTPGQQVQMLELNTTVRLAEIDLALSKVNSKLQIETARLQWVKGPDRLMRK